MSWVCVEYRSFEEWHSKVGAWERGEFQVHCTESKTFSVRTCGSGKTISFD